MELSAPRNCQQWLELKRVIRSPGDATGMPQRADHCSKKPTENSRDWKRETSKGTKISSGWTVNLSVQTSGSHNLSTYLFIHTYLSGAVCIKYPSSKLFSNMVGK